MLVDDYLVEYDTDPDRAHCPWNVWDGDMEFVDCFETKEDAIACAARKAIDAACAAAIEAAESCTDLETLRVALADLNCVRESLQAADEALTAAESGGDKRPSAANTHSEPERRRFT